MNDTFPAVATTVPTPEVKAEGGGNTRIIRRGRSPVRDSGGDALEKAKGERQKAKGAGYIGLVGLVLELGARVERLETALRTRTADTGAEDLFAVEADRIVERVGKVMGLDVDQMRSSWREQHVVEARWLAAALLTKAGFSQSAVANALGWARPSAAHYAAQRHEDCLETLKHYRLAWERLTKGEAQCG